MRLSRITSFLPGTQNFLDRFVNVTIGLVRRSLLDETTSELKILHCDHLDRIVEIGTRTELFRGKSSLKKLAKIL